MLLRQCSKFRPLAVNYLNPSRSYGCTPEEDVIFEVHGNKGVITLNKPKVLNSINLPMVCKIKKKLQEWEKCMSMVIIRGGEKAFCAGGDVVAVTKGGPKNTTPGKEFFRTEYLMNNIIGTYKIPYMAIIHGITMGGGVGLSVHGSYRIATEKTVFAMPETAIGLFPDVGGTYFLPRLEGKLGLFLALTGHRLTGADVLKAGIATHYIESKNLDDFYNKLINTETDRIETEVFPRFLKDMKGTAFSLKPKMDDINKFFSQPTVEGIFCALESEGSDWSLKTLNTMKKMSPTSLKLTKMGLEKGALMNLQEALQMENRMACASLTACFSSDFYEGVRALLVDKDKKPKWQPERLEDIKEEDLEIYFEPLKEAEELTV